MSDTKSSDEEDSRESTDEEITIHGRNWSKKTFSYRCSVDQGVHPVKSRSFLKGVFTLTMMACSPPKTSFCGECYMCGALGHSRNYCPLENCYQCEQYGHSEKVCPVIKKRTRSRIQERTRYTPCKYEFGSGWRKEMAPPVRA